MALRRYATTGALAVIVAVGATFAIHGALDAPRSQHRTITRDVVVALQDIPDGRTIDRASVAVVRWPSGTVPAGAYMVVDSVTGRLARTSIYKGEAIVRARLLPDSGSQFNKPTGGFTSR